MSHIHTGAGEHDTTASAFIVYMGGTEAAVLLHRHKKLGMWLQFGGHVELKEDPWQAITHEVSEESGYEMSQLKLLQPDNMLSHLPDTVLHPYPLYVQTHRFKDIDHYHTDIGFAFTTTEMPASSPAEDETPDFSPFTKAELIALPAGEIPENVRATCIFLLDVCIRTWSVVDTAAFR